MAHWIYLIIAIIGEVVATSALKATEGFTKVGPSLTVVAGYAVAFYFLSLTLKFIPVGISYALWSGIGIVFISGITWLVYGQKLDLPALFGIALIVAGVVVINVFSTSVSH
ncbi:DMT family transporter [Vibrio jasicida]|uniref:DMT family transporter n=1 Tax=Vibrio jasicida TaxID=766224 RepID=UPI000CE34807|nr:SMR family transporter [Vibrio jasicida]